MGVFCVAVSSSKHARFSFLHHRKLLGLFKINFFEFDLSSLAGRDILMFLDVLVFKKSICFV